MTLYDSFSELKIYSTLFPRPQFFMFLPCDGNKKKRQKKIEAKSRKINEIFMENYTRKKERKRRNHSKMRKIIVEEEKKIMNNNNGN